MACRLDPGRAEQSRGHRLATNLPHSKALSRVDPIETAGLIEDDDRSAERDRITLGAEAKGLLPEFHLWRH